VFLFSRHGELLDCNAEASRLFALPALGVVGSRVSEIVPDHPQQRIVLKLAKRLLRSKSSGIQRAHLFIGARSLQISMARVVDADSGNAVAVSGSVVDVSDTEPYRRLFAHVPVGVYEADVGGLIVRANRAMHALFAARWPNGLIKRRVGSLYRYAAEFADLDRRVKDDGQVVNYKVELARDDGQYFFASVSSVALFSDGCYNGREGMIVDVTPDEVYRRTLDEAPVAFYRVTMIDGRDLITECNAEFARAFGFESVDAVKGFEIKKLYHSPAAYDVFMEELRQLHARGEHISDRYLEVTGIDGREMVIEVTARLLTDRDGSEVGRTGVIRDITDEQLLRREMTALRADIGWMLHDYGLMMSKTRHVVRTAIEALFPDPFSEHERPNSAAIDAELADAVERLSRAMDALLSRIRATLHERGIPSDTFDRLAADFDLLSSGSLVSEPREFRQHAYRSLAHDVAVQCEALRTGAAPREPLRAVRVSAADLERIACLAGLHQVDSDIVQMDQASRTLRDHLTRSELRPRPRKRVVLWGLVAAAAQDLNEFARSEGVILQLDDRTHSAEVEVMERDVLRALGNLLHNAIKYSWWRLGTSAPRVLIRGEVVGQQVSIEYRNIGVPVPKDEIESGLVFQIGYRGRLAGERGRQGTGIGLPDALHTAHQHGGTLTLESRPAARDAPLDDYSLPFVTRAVLVLPIAPHEGDRREQ
jgi:PAS domain S-box-containing protein